MSYARKYVTDNVLPQLGLDYFHADGKRGKAAEAVKSALVSFMAEHFPAVSERAGEISVEMPWRRMFETEVRILPKD